MQQRQLPSHDHADVTSVAAPDLEHAQNRAPESAAIGQAGDAAIRRMVGGDATQTAATFYAAFAARNTGAMRAFYDPQVQFHDPLFGRLHGAAQVMEMWSTIMPAANPFQITPLVQPTAVDLGGGAWQVHVQWNAHYGLGKQIVNNESHTTLVIQNGRIVSQQDVWDLTAWTKQALPGKLGGNALADKVAGFAAHSYIEVLDLVRRLAHPVS